MWQKWNFFAPIPRGWDAVLDDRFSTEPSTTSRFGSLSSTSTYRPSFSSGSYRSPRATTTSTTSTTAPSSTVSSFISRYSSLAADKEKERERDKAKEEERRKERELREREREKERDREKERLIETSKKLEAELKESKPAPLKKSSLIAAKYGSSKDVADDSSTKSGAAGKLQSTKDAGVKPKKENAPPVTFTTRYGRAGVAREQSREPSPATRTNSSTSIAQRSRHRDPSPAPTTVTEKARSRDPSPAVETKRTGGYALAIASKLSGTKLPQQSAPNEYRRQSSGTAFGQSRARSRDPSPTVRTRTSREPSPMEQRRIQLANKMIATATRSRDPSPAPVQQLKQSKTNSGADPKQRFTSSITIKTGPGVRSRDPSPAEGRKIPTFGNASKVRSRDPSPADPKRSASALSARASRTGNESGLVKPSTFGSARKTRDPSPSVGSKVRSRDPSPATVPRRSSREPSPAESVREKYGLGGPGAYRPYGRSNSALGAGNRFGASASPVPKSPLADLALSYMTSSEAIAARTSRPSSRLRLNSQSREPSQCSSPLTASQIFSPEPRPVPNDDQQRAGSTSSETTATSSSSEESSEETESSVEPEPKIFIEITLVTRGTSPTPPGATPLIRARRAEMCKTIEKTIQKQLLPVETADKQIQSDRLDDSTKYLRYGQPSTRSWSPYVDQKYGTLSPTLGYTRYSSASSRYSRDSPSFSRETSVSSSKSDAPEKRELSTLAARVKELSLSKSNSKSTSSRSSTVSSPGGKQKTPPKQKSPEKPPPAPSKDSPSPVRSVANKDFRKSALNMGPAPDRPRKSSTSSSKSSSSSASTATPVAETNGSTSRIPHVRQQNGTKVAKRSDRSASSSSEDTSSTGGSSGTDTDREQSITRTAPNEQDDLSTATDASNANNELLLRAIQLLVR
ncbi:serine/arginine repetitive matrix protein 1-like [Anopheles moucheti]|uniref:serine/arginine repetitive matrix protein 1-like n=1 Tax=Anopheles moucheti TaxID=186751 RepID=UPI0022F13B87|nr:serine/arginine repetitive matrix protein 1-like [Anopheles moucheti]